MTATPTDQPRASARRNGFTYIIWQRNKSWRKPAHPDTPTAIPVPPN